MYQITDYSYRQAKMLGVEIKSSTNKTKKIDVFKNGEKIASIGAIGYKDYPTYINEKGKSYADTRKKLYYIRHSKNKGLNDFYAKKILW